MKTQSQKRIGLIGTAGVPGRYGGFETLAHHLVEHLADDYSLQVYCSGKMYPRKTGRGPWKGAKRIFLPFNANGWQSIIYDVISIIHAAFFCDVLMVFGVSGAVALPFVRLFSKRQIVVHIDGQEWKRPKWSPLARKFLKWSEKVAMRYSHSHIADNPGIQRYTENTYGKSGWMIPYGGDQAKQVAAKLEDHLEYPFLSHSYVFSVCRIEPENNIDMILEAISGLPERKLVIVGNWDASAYGINLRDQYRKFHNIRMLDPIYDPRSLNLLRSNCFVYVHGHSAGGTNPSLVEAMYLGLPVLAYDVVYNRETTFSDANFFRNAAELARLLRDLRLPDYDYCGKRMGEIADKNYTWERIAGMYATNIEKLIGNEPSPERNGLPFLKESMQDATVVSAPPIAQS